MRLFSKTDPRLEGAAQKLVGAARVIAGMFYPGDLAEQLPEGSRVSPERMRQLAEALERPAAPGFSSGREWWGFLMTVAAVYTAILALRRDRPPKEQFDRVLSIINRDLSSLNKMADTAFADCCKFVDGALESVYQNGSVSEETAMPAFELAVGAWLLCNTYERQLLDEEDLLAAFFGKVLASEFLPWWSGSGALGVRAEQRRTRRDKKGVNSVATFIVRTEKGGYEIQAHHFVQRPDTGDYEFYDEDGNLVAAVPRQKVLTIEKIKD